MAGPALNLPVRLHAAVFASGAAGLVWQVLWVRQLGWVTGATTEAAAIGTAVFLGALGVGAAIGGRIADTRDPLRSLARVELVVAAVGVALALVLPGLWALPDLAVVDHRGWHVPSLATRLVQIGAALVLLGPPCVAMGATLPLAARSAVGRRVDRAGWRIGWLYAANTAGAAVGALTADLWLVPAVGVFGAQVVAAATNVAAAALAWTARPVSDDAPWHVPETTRVDRAAVALALTGFAALGLEILHVRFLGSALGPYRAVFSLVLAVHLVGLQIGAVAGGLWTRGGGHPGTGFAVAVGAFAASALGGLLAFDPEALVHAQLAAAPAVAAGRAFTALLGVDLAAVAGVVLLPAIALGSTFPLANALVQDRAETVGRRAGGLAAANTLGNATGALATGFVLLPMLGLQGSAGLLVAVAAVGGVVAASGAARSVPLAAGLAALAWSAFLPADAVLWRSFPANRAQAEGVLVVHEGVHGTVVVTGDPAGPARLWTDGHPMTSTTRHAQRYMRVLAHGPLLLHPRPRMAVIIGFGVGNTSHAASLHPLDSVHVVDRSPDVLAHASWFAHANHDVLEDPRVQVHVDDGRKFLRGLAPGTVDLIALEPPPIGHAGVSSLYSRDLYRVARTRLTEGGAIAQWLPAYQLPAPAVASLVRAFVDVFPDAVLLVPTGREMVLLGHLRPTPFDIEAVRRRLRERSAVAADLADFGLDDPVEWVVMFGAHGAHLADAVRDAAPVTDDRPRVEHHAVSHVMETSLPPDLLAPSGWPVWCPQCDPEVVGPQLALTARLYRSPDYQRFSNLLHPSATAGVPLRPATAEDRARIASSATLRALTGAD